MPIISSRQNSLVKRIREALREHDSEIVLEGPKHVADAIASGWKAIAVLDSTNVNLDFNAEASRCSRIAKRISGWGQAPAVWRASSVACSRLILRNTA